MSGIYEEERSWMLHGWKQQQNQRITGEVEAAATATAAATEATLGKSICNIVQIVSSKSFRLH